LSKVGISGQLGFMGMDADSGVNRFMLFRNLHRAIKCAGAVSSADGKHIGDTRLASAGYDLLAVRVEARAVKVAMGIDEHSTDRTET
jgi:hypothetical protein